MYLHFALQGPVDLDWKLLSDKDSLPACWRPIYQQKIKCICTHSFPGESKNKQVIYEDFQRWDAAECLIYFSFFYKK